MRLGKVYHDLEKSDYIFSFKNFDFVFSSKLYINKFERELKDYIIEENNKLTNKYHNRLSCDEYLALSLYKKIEKRGFKVYYKDREIKENETFTIDLSILDYI